MPPLHGVWCSDSSITFTPYLILAWNWAIAVLWSVLGFGDSKKWTLCGPFLGRAYNLVRWRQGDTETDHCKMSVGGLVCERWILFVGAGRSILEDGCHLNGFLTDKQGCASWLRKILKQSHVLCHERARCGWDCPCVWRINWRGARWEVRLGELGSQATKIL